ncbi:MAG: DHH family phosphoesterase [Lachnospiraceae bacterium]|nr:DHH family phosphoesterase [Lachnospiraceae bacterium]
MDYEKLLDILRGHKVWIQTHNFPDPDAIASAYGLQQFLRYHGIDSNICYMGMVDKISVTKMFTTFNIDASLVDDTDIKESDYVILVDGQKYNANLTDIPGDEVAVIDHHKTVYPCEYLYKDVRIVGSCATLIAQYYKESNTPISKEVATVLSYGLKMDTDSMNRGVTKLDIEMMEYLFDYTDQDLVHQLYSNDMELQDLRAYGAAIENIQMFNEVGLARIPFNCPDGLIAMVADFIMRLEQVTLAIIYSEREDCLKFSVRCEDPMVHAGDMTKEALDGIGDGGGHFSMAGGIIPNENRSDDRSIEDKTIYERFMKAYNNNVAKMKEKFPNGIADSK